MKKITAAIVMVMAVWLKPAAPGQAQTGPDGSRGPIAISADRLETDDEAGVADFIGEVSARQDGLTITCDRLKVYYTAPAAGADSVSVPAAAGREIDRAEGFGQVRMADGDRLATGDHVLYLARNQPRRLILTGDARLWQGRDSLAGRRITYFPDDKRSLVEGEERRRVKTVVHGAGETGAPGAPR